MKSIALYFLYFIVAVIIFFFFIYLLNFICADLNLSKLDTIELINTNSLHINSDLTQIMYDILQIGYVSFAALIISWISAVIITFFVIIFDSLKLLKVIKELCYLIFLLPVILFAFWGYVFYDYLEINNLIYIILLTAFILLFFMVSKMTKSFLCENTKKYFLMDKLNGISNAVISFKLFNILYIRPLIKNIFFVISYTIGIVIVFQQIFMTNSILITSIKKQNSDIFFMYSGMVLILSYILAVFFYLLKRRINNFE